MGICFQIIDDLLDYRGADDSLGKNIGNDFKERKVTLPLILAFKDASNQDTTGWARTIEKGLQSDRDFHLALEILKGKDILAKTYDIALKWSEIAKENLVGIPDSQTKDLMNDLCSYVVSRIS